MNLYLLTQTDVTSYDTYDSMVVAALSPEAAVQIHPEEEKEEDGYDPRTREEAWKTQYSWALSPESVTCTFIGTATPGTLEGVILASYNAG